MCNNFEMWNVLGKLIIGDYFILFNKLFNFIVLVRLFIEVFLFVFVGVSNCLDKLLYGGDLNGCRIWWDCDLLGVLNWFFIFFLIFELYFFIFFVL